MTTRKTAVCTWLVLMVMGLAGVGSVRIDAAREQSGESGGDAVISCRPTPENGEEIGSVVWKKARPNGSYRTIPIGGRYSVTGNGLRIDGVRRIDSGLYICEVHLARSSAHFQGSIHQKFIQFSVTE